MGKIPETGIVIDCCIGIDDSALANRRIVTHHRQGHDRRTRAYNSGSTHAGARMHHRYQRQPGGMNGLDPLFTHGVIANRSNRTRGVSDQQPQQVVYATKASATNNEKRLEKIAPNV
ncbi:hypothetical protein [Pseudomonas sp.]|uniref:hypothetical protein n=1 Tax=Pseudomonas sp. TaxID=306 RepID=UPI00299F46E4|nr:hypothetical protein [Pseudomonas sp.]MDX1367218.1 hypothetical protein [Pseudomonas sp.]